MGYCPVCLRRAVDVFVCKTNRELMHENERISLFLSLGLGFCLKGVRNNVTFLVRTMRNVEL